MRITTFATSGILFALAMAVGPTIASAQTTMKCEEQFNMADWDGNGQLSSAELAKIDKTYAQLNKNNDGRITQSDFRDCIAGVFQRLKKSRP